MHQRLKIAGFVTALVVAIAGLAFAQSNGAIQPNQKPLPPETHPPGDIPDTQAFITFKSSAGFHLQVPEGWAQKKSASSERVSFTHNYDGVAVSVRKASSAPTVASIKANQVAALEKSGLAVRVSKVEAVNLPSGWAVRVIYASNSKPNPVTNKQIRLEDNRYYYFQGGQLVALTLWAPYGSDNVDQWRRMSRSFGWG